MTITENTNDPFTVDFVDSRSEQAKGVTYHDLVGKAHTTAETAILNGWDVLIERGPRTVTITATDPEWVERAEAAQAKDGAFYHTVDNVGVRIAYDLHEGKKPTFSHAQSASCHMDEIFDDDYNRTGEHEPKLRWNGAYRKADELTMKGANSLLFSASPRKRKVEEIKALARAAEIEQIKASYAAEADSPARRSLRQKLQALRDKEIIYVAKFKEDIRDEDPDDVGYYNLLRALEWNADSVQVSAWLVRLVDQVFDLEGNATSDGYWHQRDENPLYTLTLEAATIMVATSCMKTLLRDVRGSSSSGGSFSHNMYKQARQVALAQFADQFCPVVKDGLDGYIYADLDDEGIAQFVKAADRGLSI
jgi:hypothetical protein